MEVVIDKNKVILNDSDKKTVGEVCFEEIGQDIYNISHVFVDEKLRGQNIASKLMEYTIKELKQRGAKKIEATCSYAARWLEKNYM